ncbi:MAG: hypothetical protein U5K69_25235 [Balneolaceae bacterium]|nr:hypothetical protein [Balneolaceae bacterium]
MNEFLGFSNLEWIAISAIAVAINTIVIAVTVFLGYKKIKQASQSSQFLAVNRLQELMDSFKKERHILYSSFPIELVVTNEQFAKKPPSRHKKNNVSKAKRERMRLSDKQIETLKSLTNEQIELAKYIISKINDIGQMVEDEILPETSFFW